MPLQETSGNLTTDAFGGGVAVAPKYIEDYFSTYLYTGTNASKTITNNIDLSTKGGLVWIKDRTNANDHLLYDTVRGAGSLLSSDSTGAAITYSTAYDLASFTTTGFTLGANGYGANVSSANEVSWSFAKAPKFFDIVTYTGTGSAQTINHNLGSAPGSIIIKQTSGAGGTWWVWHTATNTYVYRLNTTDSQIAWGTLFNGVQPTSTSFQVGANGNSNANGETYVAYIFAHNAGGFGLTGTDNVISCGSYTQSTGQIVNLGFEPQWIMIKRTDDTSNWIIEDVMRGESYTQGQQLRPNLANAEVAAGADLTPTANGFIDGNALSGNVIYIAIRRGPMKVPTDATKVFAPVLNTGTGANTTISSGGFAPDMLWNKTRDHSYGTEVWDKLRGVTRILETTSTTAEVAGSAGYDLVSFNNTGVTEGVNSSSAMNISGWTYVNYMFGRAPSFFDEVCYTGNLTANTAIPHNLGAVPELIIVKSRSAAANWIVYNSASGNQAFLILNTTAAVTTGDPNVWAATTPTSSNFYIGASGYTNINARTYVAYLFATCNGVSKVGSYTGNGTTQTINCGFTSGARFVLIKRTDYAGDWYVYDTARGMTTLTDPYLLLNSTAAETATLGSVTTVSTGFALNETILSGINSSSATYIFLAIA
jgi:hypothetical protein